MTASKLLPSTQLAMLQEKAMERRDYTKVEAARLLLDLHAYELLLRETHNSNLHARQSFIRAGLSCFIFGARNQDDFDIAMRKTAPLFRDGYSIEGPDYCLYIQVAIDWYNDVTHDMAYTVCEQAADNYRELVAPDFTIPVPEATMRSYGTYTTACISNDKYIVQRWPSGAYLLVDIGAECDAGNLHDWLSAGYFALGIMKDHTIGLGPATGATSWTTERRFEWVHRCPAYTGFSWANVLGDSVLAGLLPKGALLPGWRLKLPRVTVVKKGNGVAIAWRYPWLPTVKRIIIWSPTSVVVEDRWGWFGKSVRKWVV